MWCGWVAGVAVGATYRYRVTTASGGRVDKADPFGSAHHQAPSIDSIVAEVDARVALTSRTVLQTVERCMAERLRCPDDLVRMGRAFEEG